MKFEVSLDEVHDFAVKFWEYSKSARIFLFNGDMGAGKTTIISALCKYKGVSDAISSPTYSIINLYSYSENGNDQTIYHIDLYRLKDEEEIMQAGVEDCIYSGSICMVEWPGKAPNMFDQSAVKVNISPLAGDIREVNITLPTVIMKEQS